MTMCWSEISYLNSIVVLIIKFNIQAIHIRLKKPVGYENSQNRMQVAE